MKRVVIFALVAIIAISTHLSYNHDAEASAGATTSASINNANATTPNNPNKQGAKVNTNTPRKPASIKPIEVTPEDIKKQK